WPDFWARIALFVLDYRARQLPGRPTPEVPQLRSYCTVKGPNFGAGARPSASSAPRDAFRPELREWLADRRRGRTAFWRASPPCTPDCATASRSARSRVE